MQKFWSEKEIKILDTLLEKMPVSEIAKKLGRTTNAVDRAIHRYNLKTPKTRQIDQAQNIIVQIESQEEIDQIKEETKQQFNLDWKIAKSTKKAVKNPFRKYLIIADVHDKEVYRPALNAVLQYTEQANPDGFVIAGDFLNLDSISHWNKNKHRTVEGQRLVKEYAVGNQILDAFDKRLPVGCDKHYLFGNHEKRWADLVEEIPQLEGVGSPETELKLKERGYKVYAEQNQIVKLNKLSVIHGHCTGQFVAKKHLDEYKTNVLAAHNHTMQLYLDKAPGREIAFYSASMGCLCSCSPDYMQNKPNRASHGFAVVYLMGREWFQVDLVRIIAGKFIYNGQVFDGN